MFEPEPVSVSMLSTRAKMLWTSIAVIAGILAGAYEWYTRIWPSPTQPRGGVLMVLSVLAASLIVGGFVWFCVVAFRDERKRTVKYDELQHYKGIAAQVESVPAAVVSVCCPLGRNYGLKGSQLVVGLRIVAVVPFRFRPVKVSWRGELFADTGTGQFEVLEHPFSLQCDNTLEAPQDRIYPIAAGVDWGNSPAHPTTPPGLQVRGTVTLAGPWPEGIRPVGFQDYLLVPLRK